MLLMKCSLYMKNFSNVMLAEHNFYDVFRLDVSTASSAILIEQRKKDKQYYQ